MDDAASETIEQASETLEMSIDAPEVFARSPFHSLSREKQVDTFFLSRSTEAATIDLSQLKLKRIERDPDTLSDLGLEGHTKEDCPDIELDDAELQEFEGGYVRVSETISYSLVYDH